MNTLMNVIKNSQVITVLTGAGVSTESGIPDFRSNNGIWTNNIHRTKIISLDYFLSKPKLFWKNYKEIFNVKLMNNYEPTTTHLFLKQLEKEGRDIRIFTQNVDGLHRKAGSHNVFEMHGSIEKAFCPKCKTIYSLDYIMQEEVPRCNRVNKKGVFCGFILKPDVVLFGDTVRFYEEAINSINQSSLFLVLGSSLEVYPVNQLPKHVQYTDKVYKGIVNREPTVMDEYFNDVVHKELQDFIDGI